MAFKDKKKKDEYNKKYREENKEYLKEYSRNWYKNSVEYHSLEYRKENAKRQKQYYETNRESAKKGKIRLKYGISIEEYDGLVKKQNNLCAICNLPEKSIQHGNVIALSVDHDHNTGKIRGLLCRACNHGIGNFIDNTETLKSAIVYLERQKIGNLVDKNCQL